MSIKEYSKYAVLVVLFCLFLLSLLTTHYVFALSPLLISAAIALVLLFSFVVFNRYLSANANNDLNSKVLQFIAICFSLYLLNELRQYELTNREFVVTSLFASLIYVLLFLASLKPKQKQSAALILSSMFIMALSCELIFRALDIYRKFNPEFTASTNERFHHNYRPGDYFLNYHSKYDKYPPTEVKVNSLAFRGPEQKIEQKEVLILGDSFIQADEIPWEKTMGFRLDQLLGGANSSAKVISHGISSWSPLLQWNWYLKVGKQFKPKTVFLFLFWNDFIAKENYSLSDDSYSEQVVMDKNGRPDYFILKKGETNWAFSGHNSQVIRLAKFIWQRSSVGIAIRRKIRSITGKEKWRGIISTQSALETVSKNFTAQEQEKANFEFDRLRKQSPQEFEKFFEGMPEFDRVLWKNYRKFADWTEQEKSHLVRIEDHLKKFRDDVAESEGRLVIVYVPDPWQVGQKFCPTTKVTAKMPIAGLAPHVTGTTEWLEQTAKKLKVEYLNPNLAMREYWTQKDHTEPLYFPHDCHWTSTGHEFLANYLYKWLKKNPPQLNQKLATK